MSSTAGLELTRRGHDWNFTLPTLRIGHTKLQRWTLDAAVIGQNDRVLNLGYQSSGLLRPIMRLTEGQVTAVDCSAEAANTVRRLNRAAVESGRLRVYTATIGMLPFRSRDFDVVTALNAVTRWPDLATGLRETRRVLRKGGRLVIVNELASQADAEHKGKTPTYRVPDADELIAVCQRLGFRRVTAERHKTKHWLRVIATD